MKRGALLAAAWTMLVAFTAAGPAAADDALIDVGVTQAWLRLSHLPDAGTVPATGLAARWMFVDGHGEVMIGGRIAGWKPLWGKESELDNLGLDLEMNAQFGGRFRGDAAHVMPFFGFAAGFRSLFLNTQSPNARALSGFGITLMLGVHGYFGRDSGLYWRLAGFGSGHLLFPQPGWTGGGGVELTVGAYLD
jgi:hypothetical protein